MILAQTLQQVYFGSWLCYTDKDWMLIQILRAKCREVVQQSSL
jgi:hypothetical protein